MTKTFTATIEIIGVNPYVEVPEDVLTQLQKNSGKAKGPVPVKGLLNGEPYLQTVVKFQGLWRLYLNTPMRKATKTDVGDTVTVTVEYDATPRLTPAPQAFLDALASNQKAKIAFEQLPPYRQKEISRYLANLKSDEKLHYNIERTIKYLSGENVKGVLYR